ncbi:MAG: hypothetical protein JWQ18_1883 [Conexibacter sp.]|nr:hypothetical protein [Conexibacter sp.]
MGLPQRDERGVRVVDPLARREVRSRVIVEAITARRPQTRHLTGDAVAMGSTVHDGSDQQLDEMFAGSSG